MKVTECLEKLISRINLAYMPDPSVLTPLEAFDFVKTSSHLRWPHIRDLVQACTDEAAQLSFIAALINAANDEVGKCAKRLKVAENVLELAVLSEQAALQVLSTKTLAEVVTDRIAEEDILARCLAIFEKYENLIRIAVFPNMSVDDETKLQVHFTSHLISQFDSNRNKKIAMQWLCRDYLDMGLEQRLQNLLLQQAQYAAWQPYFQIMLSRVNFSDDEYTQILQRCPIDRIIANGLSSRLRLGANSLKLILQHIDSFSAIHEYFQMMKTNIREEDLEVFIQKYGDVDGSRTLRDIIILSNAMLISEKGYSDQVLRMLLSGFDSIYADVYVQGEEWKKIALDSITNLLLFTGKKLFDEGKFELAKTAYDKALVFLSDEEKQKVIHQEIYAVMAYKTASLYLLAGWYDAAASLFQFAKEHVANLKVEQQVELYYSRYHFYSVLLEQDFSKLNYTNKAAFSRIVELLPSAQAMQLCANRRPQLDDEICLNRGISQLGKGKYAQAMFWLNHVSPQSEQSKRATAILNFGKGREISPNQHGAIDSLPAATVKSVREKLLYKVLSQLTPQVSCNLKDSILHEYCCLVFQSNYNQLEKPVNQAALTELVKDNKELLVTQSHLLSAS